jgi:hypothetical protein
MNAAAPTPPANSPALPLPLARLRLFAINAFIAAFLLALAIDVVPQSPLALRLKLQRVLVPLGLAQGPWNLFAPGPDRTNMRLRAEITYRDGQRVEWAAPTWREQSAAAMWAGHRRREWLSHLVTQEAAPVWEPWARHLAREQRPELPDADRGAVVRVIYRLGPIPAAESRPWRSIREPTVYEEAEFVLTIERFE